MTDETPKPAIPGLPIKRQAVVVVHGQGQQRPMGTIRDFVDVLWQRNGDLGPYPADGREIWIVPDDKSGLFEMQRITTPEYPKDNGRRTDFFELYYADLLNDTPVRNLWLWAQRLLGIRLKDVTPRMRWPVIVFWLIAILIGAMAVVVGLSVPNLLAEDWAAPWADPANAVPIFVIVGCIALLILRRPIPEELVLGPFSIRLSAIRNPLVTATVFGVILLALGALYRSPEFSFLGWWQVWVFPIGVVLILLAYFVMSFLLPLFGDAASYLSAQTETVRSRQAVRERGLKLLRALHDDPAYERIVIIAHSLGTVLAYDLIHLLWQAVGPTKDNPPSPEALRALQAIDAFKAKIEDDFRSRGIPQNEQVWPVAVVEKYQMLQWQAFDLLRQQDAVAAEEAKDGKPAVAAIPAGWKISDFVSLGSPLASAQFLVTEGEEDFKRMKAERILPTAPPQPYDSGEGALHIGKEGAVAMHHGAVFGVVRWTNIYDEFSPITLVGGDIISGPVSGRSGFGDGILDIDVKVRREPPFRRLFTHNHYWVEPYEKSRPVAEHIDYLRDAVGLYRGAILPTRVKYPGAAAPRRR